MNEETLKRISYLTNEIVSSKADERLYSPGQLRILNALTELESSLRAVGIVPEEGNRTENPILSATCLDYSSEEQTSLIANTKFEERYDAEEHGTTTLYFTSPKEFLKVFIPTKDYPDAVSMEISIEFPTKHIEAAAAEVSVSPTREIDGGTEDYDWYDAVLSYNEINALIALAEKTKQEVIPITNAAALREKVYKDYMMNETELNANFFDILVEMPEKDILNTYFNIVDAVNGDAVVRFESFTVEPGETIRVWGKEASSLIPDGMYDSIYRGNCKDFLESFNKKELKTEFFRFMDTEETEEGMMGGEPLDFIW